MEKGVLPIDVIFSLCRREQKLWEATSLAFRHMDLVRGGHEGVSSFL
jgi:hypothetical protein